MTPRRREAGAPTSLIRKAERRDTARLLEMVAALAAHHGDRATVTARSLERDVFGPDACSQALVAEVEGDLAGYALIGAFPHLHFGRRVLELHHLFVDPAQRGAGIGRQLIAATVEEARRQDCGRIMVSTQAENQVAQGIYRSVGFEEQAPRGVRFGMELPGGGALPAGWI